MKKKILSLLLVLVLLAGILPTAAATGAQETSSVTAYFSLTDDDKYVVGDNNGGGSGSVIAYQKLTVPYFDLKLYGLENYYFRSESYGSGGISTDPNPDGKVTVLHMLIYALELNYCGLPAEECGKGYLKENNLIGTSVLEVSGSAGSLFLQQVWDHDLNLLYYVNYQYPTASEGFGSTMDQILLRDGDIVSMSMYSDWSFYFDDAAGFHHLGTTENKLQGVIEANAEDALNLTLYRSSASMGDEANQTACGGLDVYYTSADSMTSGDVTTWTSCGKTDENGAISIDLKMLNLSAGNYIFSVAGQASTSGAVVSCPGGTLVSVEELVLKKGSGTEEDPYLLENAEDLETLSALVASGETYAGKYFKITNDITLPENWTPIGGPKEGETWTPTINKKKVNLFSGYIDGAKADGSGCWTITVPKGGKTMLGAVEHAKLSNLNIYGEKIDGYGVVEYYSNIGYGNTPSIEITNVTLKSGSHTKYSGFIGGYASGSNDVIIRDCTVEEGVVIGDDGTYPEWAEELQAAYSYPWGPDSVQYNDMIGSFGGAMSGTIENCVSHAKVYGRRYVGGILGFKGQSMGDCIVRNCVFDGEVHASGSFAGGILGGGYSASSAPNTPAATIENCAVTGSVTGATCVGGIFGGEEQQKQCWNNGIGYIRGNYFSGTVQATDEDGAAGGIIGYMNSLDCYNVISHNYYIAGSAEQGIGKVNEANVDLTSEQYARKDDPLGKNAENLTASFEAEELKNGTLVGKLNAALTGNAWTQGTSAPVLSTQKRVVRLKCTKLNKNPVSIWKQDTGYDNLKDKTVTVTYSDGSTEDIDASVCAISGVDFSKTGYQLAALTYKGYQLVFGVRITAGGTAPSEPTTKAVTVSVLGDTVHEVTSDNVHTLAQGNLTPWITDATVLVGSDATALTAFDAACTAYGLSYVAQDSYYGGKYISAVTSASGVELTDQSNQQSDGKSYSGWMFSVDGTTPYTTMDVTDVTGSLVVYFEDDYSLAYVSGIEEAIDALPDPVTEEAVSAIENQIQWLSPVALEKISNLQDLTDAREQLAVSKVMDLIDAIGEVTKNSGDDIKAARDAYDALTKEQKKLVSNYQTLQEARARYAALKASSVSPILAILSGAAGDTIPFTDVSEGDACYDAVSYLYDHDIMNGTSGTTFSPDAELTRGMVVTILYRMEGEPLTYSSKTFSDVQSGRYYSEAVKWAAENGIVNGFDDGTFKPDQAVTREQLAAILYRYAGFSSIATYDAELPANASVSGWAKKNVAWAYAEGILSSAQTAAAAKNANRAEVAMAIYAYLTGTVR